MVLPAAMKAALPDYARYPALREMHQPTAAGRTLEATVDDDGATRIREFRAMVQALHRLGLRVGMDVVYNHTSASGQSARAVLDRIVPGYYQRLNAAGDVETSTCCANTATENVMMDKLMRDSVVVWARDYGIDSFRFDLMGHQPRAAMERVQVAVDHVLSKATLRDLLQNEEEMNSWVRTIPGAKGLLTIQ